MAFGSSNRPVSVKSGPIIQNPFFKAGSAIYAVQGRKIQVRRAACDIQKIVNEFFALFELAQKPKCT